MELNHGFSVSSQLHYRLRYCYLHVHYGVTNNRSENFCLQNGIFEFVFFFFLTKNLKVALVYNFDKA
jgi:hypothetical protein